MLTRKEICKIYRITSATLRAKLKKKGFELEKGLVSYIEFKKIVKLLGKPIDPSDKSMWEDI